jgi:hypothetical protein
MVTTEEFQRLLVKKVGPIGKVFLKKAMESLEIDEITDDNVELVLEILKLNPVMKKYIAEIEEELR